MTATVHQLGATKCTSHTGNSAHQEDPSLEVNQDFLCAFGAQKRFSRAIHPTAFKQLYKDSQPIEPKEESNSFTRSGRELKT